jgi:DNA-binding NarL/FixJ family response regulator
MINLIMADDHKLIRDGLKFMLKGSDESILIRGEAASGKELIDMLTSTEADVILIDIDMPEMNGLEATQYITANFPHSKVLVLSMLGNEKYISAAMNAGAKGYILKTVGQEELIFAIHSVARGENYISTEIAMNLLKNMPSGQPAPANNEAAPSAATTWQETSGEFTRRELEVLQLIAKGYTNTQISDMLFTSKRTVESHRQKLLEKAGCKNTASLIMYAYRHHLLGAGAEN